MNDQTDQRDETNTFLFDSGSIRMRFCARKIFGAHRQKNRGNNIKQELGSVVVKDTY